MCCSAVRAGLAQQGAAFAATNGEAAAGRHVQGRPLLADYAPALDALHASLGVVGRTRDRIGDMNGCSMRRRVPCEPAGVGAAFLECVAPAPRNQMFFDLLPDSGNRGLHATSPTHGAGLETVADAGYGRFLGFPGIDALSA